MNSLCFSVEWEKKACLCENVVQTKVSVQLWEMKAAVWLFALEAYLNICDPLGWRPCFQTDMLHKFLFFFTQVSKLTADNESVPAMLIHLYLLSFFSLLSQIAPTVDLIM